MVPQGTRHIIELRIQSEPEREGNRTQYVEGNVVMSLYRRMDVMGQLMGLHNLPTSTGVMTLRGMSGSLDALAH